MCPDRRHFLKTTAAASGALGIGLAGGASSLAAGGLDRAREPGKILGVAPAGPAPRSLEILILGGTSFLGPHQVRYAVERGHSVSIFTRGRTQPPLFHDAFERVEHLIGDREDDLEALKGGSWDAVIDNSGAQVRWTRDTAELLKDHAGAYLYVSSTGVYYPYLTTDISEDGPVLLEDPSDGENGSRAYGVMKANSEAAAQEAFGSRALVIRPGYIAGPADRSDRFTYWPVRIHRGGDVLVPGRRGDQVQFIDVRDLTEWMVHLLEEGKAGVFNATGPGSPLTMEEFVYGVKAAFSAAVNWHWVDDYDFLRENRFLFAIPWIMPEGDELGSMRIDVSKAGANGLNYRPLAITAMDTLAWWFSGALTDERRAAARFVLSPEREAELLAAWKGRG